MAPSRTLCTSGAGIDCGWDSSQLGLITLARWCDSITRNWRSKVAQVVERSVRQ